ncbi:interleukin-21 [Gouania willdenowi]|uniref:interleukin-21 n=1 Tax=Gouania willdenowi TaxID=441366 RepID=UPI00105657DE|nr:interleukin-21-like [Gouania willdenowi]
MQRRKLQETLRELNQVQNTMRQKEQMLNTPPENVEDCCCVSALTCFRANLQVQFNLTQGSPRKLYRSLKHSLTVKALDFCNTRSTTTSCQTCDSHPKEEAGVFFSRLKSLIQRGITKLSED